MTFIGQCIPCQFGRHDEHYEVIQAVPEGVMGGAVCGCKGECRDRPAERVTRALDALDMSAVDSLPASPVSSLEHCPATQPSGR